VAALTTDDLLALYLVREVLDGLAIRLATTRMTPNDWRTITEILEQMDEAAADGDAQRAAELNLRFHQMLRQVAGNPYLSRFMQQVEHAVRRSGQTIFSYPGRSEDAVKEHREMCEAIKAGDSAKAEQLAIEHVRRARRLKLQMLIEGL
jgi:DNA-binding GntR family transcriptional regulator